MHENISIIYGFILQREKEKKLQCDFFHVRTCEGTVFLIYIRTFMYRPNQSL